MQESPIANELLVAEYEALHSEIEKRLELRQQLLLTTLAIAGTFFTLGVQAGLSGLTVLVYPVLTVFLAVIGTHNDARIGQINAYLRGQEERYLPDGCGWETYRRRTFADTHPLALQLPGHQFSMRGIYLTTQGLALVLAAVRLWPWLTAWPSALPAAAALVVATCATVYTVVATQHRREPPR